MAKKSLGIDLGALLDDNVSDLYENQLEDLLSTSSEEIVKNISLDDISANPYQPRKHFDEASIIELANSIKNHGLIQPIILVDADELCKKAKENNQNITKTSKYFLVAGERRFRAFKYLKENKIKAIVANINAQNSRELALIENIQRQDLNPIELALAYKEILDEKNITQEQLAQSIQKSRANIANTLRLLNLSKQTQDLIIEGKISAGHAKVIAGQIEDEHTLVQTIIGQKLNVRDCEKLAQKIKNKQADLKIDYASESLKTNLKKLKLKYNLNKNKLIFDLSDENTKKFIEKVFNN
ncbi:ParB/RepB/Spo0J family partition protein [Campylobacter canadensis]|uniref:ParB/RepB/Spo0J family partition protein n=1 Tax=Campylobacter canadensis TaxID=449520 RepID=A0ABS7WRI7_9BACT|nr:ParB/RepB/Spo0J family partition protein [Campylobacter canadensis]MBZ7987370.1 ParB/RepB/Spo0J family partition protein [Campylobacter canadensis]MBZ7994747.1 ParB/RepB/Spo0J family partition protein [Campylobacter canadensis]MBZ7996545.1 ParB/RepB/Spo0J family partition protein [Campylobacter canadensis]MBZ7998459.1 ParB/RepB/Spo0J family partition protein [Campylobacter canadensis]MBZ8000173.1 ParB/RepB/Spo0J family partition protein [Campylobacter canadensis]